MKILLVEPDYKNKYPPLGLMKISTYHKQRGDNVFFIKGLDKNVQNQYWDRIYITSLFTFNFKITAETISFYKKSVNNTDSIFVGGILASLMPEELKKNTGINNVIVGQLTNAELIGFGDEINIDALPLDYSILDSIQYEYPAGDNYFIYTTRGCPNHCKFCAVPKLEPEFITTNNTYQNVMRVNSEYGEKRNLLLMDNNILNSPNLEEIINDIKKAGFSKGATYTYPNLFLYYLKNATQLPENPILGKKLKSYLIKRLNSIRNKANRTALFELITPYTSNDISLEEFSINSEKINEIFNKERDRRPKARFVDFNQGIDARLLTEEKMRLLSQLPIKPLRIAFDSITLKETYCNAIELASRYDIKYFSNYILYNYTDNPIELWERLKINIDLSKRLSVNIFSFPMRYAPINETNRDYIGVNWNNQYLKSITAILLSTKGIVAQGESFFYRAFGKDPNNFLEILSMPRDFIIYRKKFEEVGLSKEWVDEFHKISKEERTILFDSLGRHKLYKEIISTVPSSIQPILKFYFIKYKDIMLSGHQTA